MFSIEINTGGKLFACNATAPDEECIYSKGCVEVNKQLENSGFIVHEFNTDEYLKSGGSVFCMKMMF